MGKRKNILTKKGHDYLIAKLKELNKKRERLVEEMELARQEGDLAENSAYHQLRQMVAVMINKINEVKKNLTNVEIVEKNGDGSIGVGSQVVVKVSGKERVLYLVGNGEANPLEGKISHSSPLGSGLMGKKVGQAAEVETPRGKIKYQIIRVE